MSLRTLQRRVAKLEQGRKPRMSPIVILYGSWDPFVDGVYLAVNEGALDPDFVDILDILRAWDNAGVWAVAYAR